MATMFSRVSTTSKIGSIFRRSKASIWGTFGRLMPISFFADPWISTYPEVAVSLVRPSNFAKLTSCAIGADCLIQGPLPPSSNHTSFPVLFVSNTLDPITPIRGYVQGFTRLFFYSMWSFLIKALTRAQLSAHKMSRAFTGSAVLIQEGVGVSRLPFLREESQRR
jgi:hypothetical protein